MKGNAHSCAGQLCAADPISMEWCALLFEAIVRMERNRRKTTNVLPVVATKQRNQDLLRLHDFIQTGLD